MAAADSGRSLALSASAGEGAGVSDLDYAGLQGQERWTYQLVEDGKGGWIEKRVSRERLDRIDIRREAVGVADWSRQVDFAYDPEEKAFLIRKKVFDDRAGRYVVVNAHAIFRIDLSNSSPDSGERLRRSVIMDGNAVLLSTDKGIRAIYTSELRDLAFNAPVPNFNLIPPPGLAEEGASIESLRFLEKQSSGVDVRDAKGNRPEFLPQHDLIAEVRHHDGTTESVSLNYFESVTGPLAANLLGNLVDLQIANGDPELARDLVELIGDGKNQEALKQYSLDRNGLLIPESNVGLDSDALNSAIRATAQYLNAKKRTGVLARDKSGRNEFDKLARTPRDLIRVNDPSALIAKVEALDETLPAETLPDFKEQVVQATEKPSEKAKRILIDGARARFESLGRLVSGTYALSKKTAATHPWMMVTLAALVGGDVANTLTNGAVMDQVIPFIGSMFSWTQNVWGIADLAKEIGTEKTAAYFHENWSLVRIMIGAGAILSFRPLSYVISQGVAKMQGHDWSKQQALFNIGLSVYAKLNKPAARMAFWVKMLGQGNLYPAIENKIPLSTPGVWNYPFSHGQTAAMKTRLDENAQRLNQHLDDRAVANERALLMAAAIVSKEANLAGRPLDPVSLLELFSASRAQKYDYLVDSLGSLKSETAWKDLFEVTTAALAKLGDKGAGPVDEDAIVQYHNELIGLHARFYNDQGRDNKAARALKFVHEKWLDFVAWTSKDVVNFILFGSQGLKVYREFKDARIDARNADTAAKQYDADYDLSAVFYSLTAPNYFGAIGSLVLGGMAKAAMFVSPAALGASYFSALDSVSVFATAAAAILAAEIVFNQLEQVFVYGTLNGVDTLATHNADKGVSPEGFESEVSTVLMNRRKSAAQGGAGREITTREALPPILRSFWDPTDRANVLKMWKAKMDTTFSGFNARLVVGAVPRILGLVMVGYYGGGDLASIAMGTALAFPKQANVMVNKLAFLGNTVGYAVIWPFILAAMNAMKNLLESNTEVLEQADYLIHTGRTIENLEMVREGVQLMQVAYSRGSVSLPESLQANVEDPELSPEFIYSLSDRLVEFSRTSPPFPTVSNDGLDHDLNKFGAFVSTILYTTLGHAMYNPSLPILPQLASSLALFSATYLGLKGALAIGPPIKNAVSDGLSKVARFAGGDSGRNSSECERDLDQK